MEAPGEKPALQPPPGVVPNFADPGGSHALGYGIIISSCTISTIAVGARLWSSATAKKFVLEDYLLIIALGIFAGFQWTSYQLALYPGYWAHQWEVQMNFMTHFLYCAHIAAILYGPAAACIKVAILVNWLRIFVPAGQHNAFFWILRILIWTNIIFYVVATVTEIFRCWPREKIWNPFFEGGSCPINVELQNVAVSVFNFFSDSIILAIPQWIIWKLNMTSGRKWGLSLLFTIGISAWAFGVIRAVYFINLLNSDDVVYQMSGISIWSIWEVTTGFLIMGIPAFPRVAKNFPMSESISSFFRTLMRNSQQSDRRTGLPQWQLYKPKFRRPRGLWEISDLETHDLVSLSVGSAKTTTNQAELATNRAETNNHVQNTGRISQTRE